MKLDERDVRAMVRLIGEVAALPGGPARRKRTLMEGLGKLIGADSWVWGLSCRREPELPEVNVSIMHGGFTDEAFAKFLQALEHPEMVAFASKFYVELKEKNTHLTSGATRSRKTLRSSAPPPTRCGRRPTSARSSSRTDRWMTAPPARSGFIAATRARNLRRANRASLTSC